MSERERSRSPERSDPPAEENVKAEAPAGDDEPAPAAPQDSSGDAAPTPAADSGDAGKPSDEVKLYVGNLDYGTSGCDISFDLFKTVVQNPKSHWHTINSLVCAIASCLERSMILEF